MTSVGSVGSIFYQFGSFLFFMTGFAKNIIQVRVLLVLGNILFIINGLLGWPFWPDVIRTPLVIAPDAIIWGGLIGMCNVVKFVYEIEELKIKTWKGFFNVLFFNKFT